MSFKTQNMIDNWIESQAGGTENSTNLVRFNIKNLLSWKNYEFINETIKDCLLKDNQLNLSTDMMVALLQVTRNHKDKLPEREKLREMMAHYIEILEFVTKD